MKKRRRLKKGLAILLTAAMVVGLMPGAGTMQVSAAEPDENTVNTVSSNGDTFTATLPEGYALSDEAEALEVLVELGGAQMYESAEGETVGAFTVTGGVDNTDYTYADGVLTIKTDKAITIANTNPSTPTTDRIEVESDVNANITLAGVNIDVSKTGYETNDASAAFKIADNSMGYVTITLADGSENTLKSGAWCAGLQKNVEGGKLTIQGGTNGTGKLTATGGQNAAGIGGGREKDVSHIEISGGTVTATGGREGAGIGGGGSGTGSHIEISGGTVTATGGDSGAGIGGGIGSTGSDIIIIGGTVTATGGDVGAGIGGGWKGNGTNITISGGTVTATSSNGAGIGGGLDGSGSDITISGGTVTATSSEGAGIGGGYYKAGSNIEISGGTVTATSASGAGIGGGNGGTGSNITMNGDVVLYTSSVDSSSTFTKGVVYQGVTVSGSGSSYTLIGGVGTVYGNPNVSGFTKPTDSKLGSDFADTKCMTVTVPDVDYTGEEAAPTATVTVNKTALSKTLVQGTDYTVSVSDSDKTNVGAKNATITAVADSGNLGEINGKAFSVKTVALSADKIGMSLSGIPDGGYVYNTSAIEPVPVVTLKRADGSEYTLIKDTDYTVDYSNNTDAYELLSGDAGYESGKAPTVTITAVNNGNFTGSRSMNFKIHLADMPGFTITPYSDSYDGASHSVVESITPVDGFSDYTVYYSTDNQAAWSTTVPTITNAGTLDFYVKVTKPNYEDWISEKQTAKVTPVALASSMISFNDTNHYYTGQEVKPGITVKDSNRDLASGTDYTVSYTNNTSVSEGDSKAVVTITAANGNYTGSASAEFRIEYAQETYLNYCTVSGTAGNDDWYSSDVTIQNKAGTNSAWGALQFSGSPTGTFADSYIVSAEGDNTVTIWFKQTREGTGYIGSDSATVKIDKTAPDWNGENDGISIKTNKWKSLLSTISFGLFYKETVDVKVCASDSLSGVAAYYYYIDSTSGTVKTAEELNALSFTQYTGSVSGQNPSVNVTSLAPDGNYIVYAYAVDAAGNRSAYVCSEGVVVDSTAPTISNIVAPSKEASTLTDTTAQISFTGSEAGTYFYICMENDSNESVPNSIDDFATSGTNDKGMLSWTANQGVSSGAMTADGSNTVTLTGLEAYTDYVLYLAAVDQAGNSKQTIASKEFKTCKTMPEVTKQPTISGTYGQTAEAMTLTDGVAKVGGNVITGAWTVTDSNKKNVPDVGTTATYQVTFTPDDTYGDIYDTVIVPVKPTVSKKAITVTINDKTKTYGEANPELTYEIKEDTLVSGDDNNALGITLTCIANESSPVKAGGYAITGTSSSANYDVTVTPGVLTITKATPTITASNYTKTYGDIKFFLEATENSTESNLQYAVTESKDSSGADAENNAVVTVDARGYVTIKGAGSAKITASLPETNNYNAASEEITITVNKAKNAPNMPGTTMNVANSITKVGEIKLPADWVWSEEDQDKSLETDNDSVPTATAVYNGADKGNYETESVVVTITRSACEHVASGILYTEEGEHEPTCTVDGIGHRKCTKCNETIESNIIVKAAHQFSTQWTIDKEATTTEEGEKSRHCTRADCDARADITAIPKKSGSSGGGSSSGGAGGGSAGGGAEPEKPQEPGAPGSDDSTTSTVTNEDGSTTTTTTVTDSNGNTVTTTTTVATDGSTTEKVQATETNAAGKDVEVTTTTKTDASGNVKTITEKSVIEKAEPNTTVTVVTDKHADGKVTNATASITKTSDAGKVSLSGKVIGQITEAAGADTNVKVTMTVKDSKGSEKYTVKADSKEIVPGNKLYIYKLDVKSGKYVMVNASTYRVSAAGDVTVNMTKKAAYELVTGKEAAKITKQILATVKPAKTSKTLSPDKSTSFALSKKLNKENIKKITYAVPKAGNVMVSKKGKITATGIGTTTVKATITLKNGKKKTIKMKIKVQ